MPFVRSYGLRRFSGTAVMLLAMSVTPGADSVGGEKLSHDPVAWYEQDRRPIPKPKERGPNLTWDMVDDAIFLPLRRGTTPGRVIRRAGTVFGGDHVVPAANVNGLDEALNSTWFTNRIGLFPMSPREAAVGPDAGLGPDRSGPWTVISAKTEGVTPGFVIRDAQGEAYLIKFDPPGCLGMATRAGVVTGRILYAAGYNVPDDNVVTFSREDLSLGEDVVIKLDDGGKRPMTVADLDAILNAVDRLPDGRILALASKFVNGRPIGPFNYYGRRGGDRNDRIRHEHRRELRGLRVFAAWLNHFDTKQHNSLDAYVPEDQEGHVVHYLIDFASTLGVGAKGLAPRYGFEYSFAPVVTLRRILSLGLYEDPWRRIRRPAGLEEVGYFESDEFNPDGFRPLQPNSAFVNLTDRDGYWAAKIISFFTDEHLAAICEQAQYRDPEAAAYVARMLAERRDQITRFFFERIPPLDFFSVKDGVLVFRDLAIENGFYQAGGTRYWARIATVNSDREVGLQASWIEFRKPRLSLREVFAMPVTNASPGEAYPFLAVECRVDRGRGWSKPVTVYFSRRGGRVVEVER